MTIQKQQPTHQSHPNMEEALSGNPAAGELAQKAAALMEQLMGSTVTPKLRDLPSKADRLNALADAIERQELLKHSIGFNMNSWFSEANQQDINHENLMMGECGSVACIAGWTVALDRNGDGMDGAALRNDLESYSAGIAARAMNILGLNSEEMKFLFTPWVHFQIGARDRSLTPARAVAVIRDFAKTDTIQWNKFDRNGKEV